MSDTEKMVDSMDDKLIEDLLDLDDEEFASLLESMNEDGKEENKENLNIRKDEKQSMPVSNNNRAQVQEKLNKLNRKNQIKEKLAMAAAAKPAANSSVASTDNAATKKQQIQETIDRLKKKRQIQEKLQKYRNAANSSKPNNNGNVANCKAESNGNKISKAKVQEKIELAKKKKAIIERLQAASKKKAVMERIQTAKKNK